MSVLYVIEARVKPHNQALPTTTRYLRLENSGAFNALIIKDFKGSLAFASFFSNLPKAQQVFDEIVEQSTAPNTGGKTLLVPPVSDMVGGEHGERGFTIELNLIGIIGDGLLDTRISAVQSVVLEVHEYVGKPYTVTRRAKINLVVPPDQMLGNFNLTPPNMMEGDTYTSTSIDYAAERVIHKALAANGRPVFYICTPRGNLLNRQM